MANLPRIVNGYTLTERLGSGGFTTAYRARINGQEYCMRELQYGIDNGDDGPQKTWDLFQREGEVLARLDHPRIPKVCDTFQIQAGENGSTKTFAYMVQTLIPGRNLRRILEQGPFTEEQVVDIGLQISDVLQYLHKLDPAVVHRDVKPSNIHQDQDGRIYLLDFGGLQDKIAQTCGGSTTFGSMGYASPEQKIGKAVPQSDLYSLGATFLHLLSNVHPERMQDNAFDPLNYEPHYRFKNSSLGLVVDQLIKPRVGDRIQTAEQLADYLQQIKDGKSLKFGGQRKASWISRFVARLVPRGALEHLVQTRSDIVREAQRGRVLISGGEPASQRQSVNSTVRVVNAGDYVTLGDISCVDADNHVFEQYATLQVRKDIERDTNGNQRNFTPYDGAIHFEQQGHGLFLPSIALSCNVVATLFRAAVQRQADGSYRTIDENAKRVLDQYRGHGNSFGYHGQNTVVDFRSGKVIHYPNRFTSSQTNSVNSNRSGVSLSFDKRELQDELLEDALRNPNQLRYVRQLTGLQDPSVLVDVAKYFSKHAKLWFPWSGRNGSTCQDKRAAWLGCGGSDFSMVTSGGLSYYVAVRGVRLA